MKLRVSIMFLAAILGTSVAVATMSAPTANAPTRKAHKTPTISLRDTFNLALQNRNADHRRAARSAVREHKQQLIDRAHDRRIAREKRAAAAAAAAAAAVQPSAPTYASSAPAVSSGSVWDQIAICESSGQWDYNGGSGYDGGLQFSPGTWSAYAPADYPSYAWQASREQQIAIAEKVLAAQGWGAWPACSSKLGLR